MWAIDKPTRKGKILDLCFTSNPSQTSMCNTLKVPLDHNSARIQFSYPTKNNTTQPITHNIPYTGSFNHI